jgi:hypothetical protein
LDNRLSCTVSGFGQNICVREMHQLDTDIDALAARAARGERSVELARDMEDLLCDGYAACLQVDSRIRRLERLRRQLASSGIDGQETDVRQLDECRDSLEHFAAETRSKLAALRERFVHIGGMQAAVR